MIVGIAYCSVIAACHQVFDVRRAQEWTAALDSWCESQPQLVHFRGLCLLNRAELRQFHGAWERAAAEAREASERLAETDESLGEAMYQTAELHRLRGRVRRCRSGVPTRQPARSPAGAGDRAPPTGAGPDTRSPRRPWRAPPTRPPASSPAPACWSRWSRSCWPPGRRRRPGWPRTRWCRSPATSARPC